MSRYNDIMTMEIKILKEREKEILAGAPNPCILCNEECMGVGVFKPHDSFKFGAPTGMRRILAYGICPSCSKINNVEEQVEDIFLRELEAVEV